MRIYIIPYRKTVFKLGLVLLLASLISSAIADQARYGQPIYSTTAVVFMFVGFPIGALLVGYSVAKWARCIVAAGFVVAAASCIFFAEGLFRSAGLGTAFGWYGAIIMVFCIIPLWILSFIASVIFGIVLHKDFPANGYCTQCGYNLFGLMEPRCPECGTPFDPKLLETLEQTEPESSENLTG